MDPIDHTSDADVTPQTAAPTEAEGALAPSETPAAETAAATPAEERSLATGPVAADAGASGQEPPAPPVASLGRAGAEGPRATEPAAATTDEPAADEPPTDRTQADEPLADASTEDRAPTAPAPDGATPEAPAPPTADGRAPDAPAAAAPSTASGEGAGDPGAEADAGPTTAAAGAAADVGTTSEAGPASEAEQAAEADQAAAALRSGQIVEGRVTSVTSDEVVLELGDGSVGVIGKRHLTANGKLDPTELLAVGDGVEAAVLVRDDPKGRIVLSRAWALKQRAWEQVEAAKAANRPITGRVTGQVKGGLVVDVGTRAFLPASQIDLHHVDDLSSYVGQDIEAVVQEADRANDKVVLSRRSLLRGAQRSKANEFAATLAPGQVHRGRVSLLTDFGAFVEVGGVRGLVHLSELSWGRVERADEVVTPGTEVDVKVLAVKPGKKLSLSIRALTPDPLTTLQTGQVLPGVVTRLADFGAFVRVGDGAEGLVHVTELAEYRVHAPEEVVTPGDEVLVKVIRIDRKRRRLDLSVNQALLS